MVRSPLRARYLDLPHRINTGSGGPTSLFNVYGALCPREKSVQGTPPSARLRMSGVLQPLYTGKTVPLHTLCTQVIYQGFRPFGPVFETRKICHTYPVTNLVLETHVKQ